MKTIINGQVTLSRPLEGPLASQITAFAKWSDAQGYSPYSLHRHVLLASDFSRWLGRQGIKAWCVSSMHPQQYLADRARRVRISKSDAPGLKHFMAFLRREAVIGEEKMTPKTTTPVEQCVQKFACYLRDERGLATATIINYLPFIRELLKQRFADKKVQLRDLSASDVVGLVQRHAPQLGLKRAKLMTTALRSFLQYARYRGAFTLDLAAAIPPVAGWSMTSIPRAIPADQVRKVLASVDRRTPTGCRDYAILLLLARLGLRSGEVTRMELGDIDWKAGVLRVHGKSGRPIEVPLPADVGEAVVAYLQDARPRSTNRRVFLRDKAPIRGFLGSSAVGSIVRRAIERAGVSPPTHGAHQFRHALATEMLRGGASLAEIGGVLGHQSLETTRIYAKVDLDALRALALPWPGDRS